MTEHSLSGENRQANTRKESHALQNKVIFFSIHLLNYEVAGFPWFSNALIYSDMRFYLFLVFYNINHNENSSSH